MHSFKKVNFFSLAPLYWYGAIFGFLVACGQKKSNTTDSKPPTFQLVQAPEFNADSAYYFVERQVKFGPRTPNSAAHQQAAEYFIEIFTKYGHAVQVQNFEVTSYDSLTLQGKNIIATYNPGVSKRILLAAHWDTRRISDKDKNQEARNKPIDGADDGASGVGVLLEIARMLQVHKPNIGVDFILFDLEDDGTPDKSEKYKDPSNNFYCHGSRYWSKNKHQANYSAYFGILLDMVGAKNAKFYKEGYSMQYAPEVTNQVWTIAQRLGYSNYFINQKMEGGGIFDDHYYVNVTAKINMVDIIYYDITRDSFGGHHHTQADNLSIIDKNTLKAVGQTVVQVLYQEAQPNQ